MIDEFLAQQDILHHRLNGLMPSRVRGLNSRLHGDFNLARVLIVKDDVFITGFEGDLRQPIEERRRKAPVARDVANMIWSIETSSLAARERALHLAPDEHGRLGNALAEWVDRATAAFLAAYRELMADSSIWPDDPLAARHMVDFFVLEKAFDVLETELTQRPEAAAGDARPGLADLVPACPRGRMTKLSAEAYAILEGRHSDPFQYLGPHTEGGRTVVRAFLPEADKVDAIAPHGEAAALTRVHDDGLFAGFLPNGSTAYQLRARFGETVVDLDDPYRFPPVLTDYDLYLLGEGTHQRLYEKLGAHPMVLEGVPGVAFVVLAPNAQRVSVVGDFNFWNPKRHPMRVRGLGYWELFIPHALAGDRYKFDIFSRQGELAAEVRSAGLCRRNSPEHGLGRVRRGKAAASAARPRQHQFVECAGIDLRGASRIVAAQGR